MGECSRGGMNLPQTLQPFFFWTRKEVTSPKEVTPKERAASKLPGLAGAPIPCASRCAFHCRPGRALLPPPDLLALRVHSASSLFAHPVLLSAKTATSTNPELASVLPGWTSACYRGLRQSSAWASRMHPEVVAAAAPALLCICGICSQPQPDWAHSAGGGRLTQNGRVPRD